MPEMASEVVHHGEFMYKLIRKHPRDEMLRENREGCVFSICDPFFPYQNSTEHAFRHMAATLD